MFGDLLRELRRHVKFVARDPASFFTWALNTSFWFIAIVLGVGWYARDVESVAPYLFWGVVTFGIFSEFAWGAASVRQMAIAGVIEQVLAARGSLSPFVVWHIISTALVWMPIDISAALAVYFVLFGEMPIIKEPLYFAIAFSIFFVFATAVSSSTAMLLMRSRNPWIGAGFLQFAVPLSGGMISPVLLPPKYAACFLYSPFHYVIAPLIYSATGHWLLKPHLILAIGIAVTVAFCLLSRAVESAVSKRIRVGFPV